MSRSPSLSRSPSTTEFTLSVLAPTLFWAQSPLKGVPSFCQTMTSKSSPKPLPETTSRSPSLSRSPSATECTWSALAPTSFCAQTPLKGVPSFCQTMTS